MYKTLYCYLRACRFNTVQYVNSEPWMTYDQASQIHHRELGTGDLKASKRNTAGFTLGICEHSNPTQYRGAGDLKSSQWSIGNSIQCLRSESQQIQYRQLTLLAIVEQATSIWSCECWGLGSGQAHRLRGAVWWVGAAGMLMLPLRFVRNTVISPPVPRGEPL